MTETTNFNLQKPEMTDTVENMVSAYNSNFDTIDNQLANVENLKFDLNILSNVEFLSERTYNETAQPNTPFATENYEYISAVEDAGGVYSNAFLLPNGKYRLTVTSKTKPSNMDIAIYNPFYGCYCYNDDEYVYLDWVKQDDKYICDFEIKTDYSQSYVMLGDPSKNLTSWNKLNIELYKLNESENYATKSELKQQSTKIETVKSDVSKTQSDISSINDSRLYISPTGYLYSKDKIALNGQTVIGTKAFSNCQEITKVDVPNGVTILESESFWGCRSLTSLTVAQSVVTLGTNAFSNCTALTSVKLSEGLKTVGMWAFASCTSLRNINIPTTVTTIIMKAFSGCTALESVTIPAGLTTVGREPFLGCTSLSNVVLGNGFNCNGLDLTGCPLTVDCMVAMFNALANLTGKAAKTLILGADNLAKLTETQKQLATNKNWNLI